MTEILHWVEVFARLIAIVFVGIGILHLLLGIAGFWGSLGQIGVHTAFQDVLSDILLLVVGIELAILLVRRAPESLVEVMFFVIARKMLIKTDSFYDILIGIAVLGGLFAIRKYLTTGRGQPAPRPSE